jgi:uncharacterized protein (TIGR03083 family)
MDSSRLLECLADDVTRLRDVAAKDLTAAVPSCPGWTVADLVRHVAEVYLHKAEAMRQQRLPSPWPPDLTSEEPITLLDRAYTELRGELSQRDRQDPAFTWHAPDQTVGFWIRRMAQETVIHRVDAELALGESIGAIPTDLAVDGIDEVLRIFLEYGSHTWREDFAGQLSEWGERSLLVTTDGSAWRVVVRPDGAVVTAGATGDATTTVRGEPAPLLLWLWNRGGDDWVIVTGEPGPADDLRRLLTVATQ